MIILNGKVSSVWPNGMAHIAVANDTNIPDILQVSGEGLTAGQSVHVIIEPLKSKAAGASLAQLPLPL